MNDSAVAQQFSARLRAAIQQTRDLKYNPRRFEEMLDTRDAVHVAKRMVATSDLHDGFKEVVALGRPDLTMESIMLEPQFRPLFTPSELDAARWRLDQVLRKTNR